MRPCWLAAFWHTKLQRSKVHTHIYTHTQNAPSLSLKIFCILLITAVARPEGGVFELKARETAWPMLQNLRLATIIDGSLKIAPVGPPPSNFSTWYDALSHGLDHVVEIRGFLSIASLDVLGESAGFLKNLRVIRGFGGAIFEPQLPTAALELRVDSSRFFELALVNLRVVSVSLHPDSLLLCVGVIVIRLSKKV